jgi:son of sevenless-like protein
MNMELSRGHMESQAIQRGTSEEILQVLQTIMKRIDDMSPLNVQSLQPVEDKMESLQTVRIVLSHVVYATLKFMSIQELLGPSLEPSQGWSVPEGFLLADCKIAAPSMHF